MTSEIYTPITFRKLECDELSQYFYNGFRHNFRLRIDENFLMMVVLCQKADVTNDFFFLLLPVLIENSPHAANKRQSGKMSSYSKLAEKCFWQKTWFFWKELASVTLLFEMK
ncbi:hypothetical protein CDAR_579901 [Caerostris darwini]|uniref:Uncharacterized protein n=1 Tax=Caerostris darwini TaxID=1538125 RepID=A0AAV4MSX7_9ARAC|nr:hypothetical protein CDAR_579901 [Caerostris darwini]